MEIVIGIGLVIIGVVIGIVLMALCAVNNASKSQEEQQW